MVIEWKCWDHIRRGSEARANASLVSSEKQYLNLNISDNAQTAASRYLCVTSSFHLGANQLEVQQQNHAGYRATYSG